jgi:sugar phosphate isomerase/epimerase
MRIIQDVGLDNLGINLDPANLLLYGKANPLDAVGIFGGLVRGVHVKDGQYPTNPRELGKETRVGEGLVNFPELLARLVSYGYEGPLIIEREAGGADTEKDIRQTVGYLRQVMAQL